MNHEAYSVSTCKGLVINAPHIFKDAAFVQWLNNGEPKFTVHQGGEPGEWSDLIVLVDPSLNGEGSDSDMPEHVWNHIIEACRRHVGRHPGGFHIMVRLTNVED